MYVCRCCLCQSFCRIEKTAIMLYVGRNMLYIAMYCCIPAIYLLLSYTMYRICPECWRLNSTFSASYLKYWPTVVCGQTLFVILFLCDSLLTSVTTPLFCFMGRSLRLQQERAQPGPKMHPISWNFPSLSCTWAAWGPRATAPLRWVPEHEWARTQASSSLPNYRSRVTLQCDRTRNPSVEHMGYA